MNTYYSSYTNTVMIIMMVIIMAVRQLRHRPGIIDVYVCIYVMYVYMYTYIYI